MTRRFAVVGTGARAETFIRSLVTSHADRAELVALADVNPARIRAHNRWLGDLGHPPVPGYPAGDFAAMLDNEKVDAVIVTTVDATHERVREAHGGGDERMTAMLFSGDSSTEDPLGRRATEVDGAWALLTGLAANASARERRPVAVSELVDPTLLSEAKE